jgi:type IV pilus assembly protein PilX
MVMAMLPQSFSRSGRQRGAILFVAMVFLILITLLALTASNTSVLQERMTGGIRNNQLALMGAESALRNVEWTIWDRSNGASGANKLDCSVSGGATGDACYMVRAPNATVTAFRNARNWLPTSSDGANAYNTYTMTGLSNAQTTSTLANQPRYLIEDLGIVLPPNSPSSGEGGGRMPVGTAGAANQTLYSFRINARSAGGNQGSVRAVESYFVALPPSH